MRGNNRGDIYDNHSYLKRDPCALLCELKIPFTILASTASKDAVAGMTKNVASHYAHLYNHCSAIVPVQVPTNTTYNLVQPDKQGMEQAMKSVNQ